MKHGDLARFQTIVLTLHMIGQKTRGTATKNERSGSQVIRTLQNLPDQQIPNRRDLTQTPGSQNLISLQMRQIPMHGSQNLRLPLQQSIGEVRMSRRTTRRLGGAIRLCRVGPVQGASRGQLAPPPSHEMIRQVGALRRSPGNPALKLLGSSDVIENRLSNPGGVRQKTFSSIASRQSQSRCPSQSKRRLRLPDGVHGNPLVLPAL